MINLGDLFQQPKLASGGLFVPGHPPEHDMVSPDGDARRSAYQIKKNPPLSGTMSLGDQTPVSPEQPDGVGDGCHSHSNGFPQETPPPDATHLEATQRDDEEAELPPKSPEHVEAQPPPAPERLVATGVPQGSQKFVDENGKTMYQNGVYWKLLSMHVHMFFKSIRWDVKISIDSPTLLRLKRYCAPKHGPSPASQAALDMFKDKEKRALVILNK